jgi:hypothetical protein
MKLFSLTLLLFVGSMLYADVMYEMVSTSEGMMGMKGETNMRIFVKGDRSLTEMTAENPMGGTMTDTKIIRLDKGVIWSIDHDKRNYTEIAIAHETPAMEEQEEEMLMPDLQVVRTGETKKILDKDCEKVVVTMDFEDDAGATTLKQTMWVTNDVPGYQEIQNFQQHMTGSGSMSSGMMGGNKRTYEEFQKKTSEIEGFPLEINMEMTMGAEGMSFSLLTHSEVTKIETNPISDKVFEIPAGYSLKE